jgi:DNA-binding MarR family transcriptional regulator
MTDDAVHRDDARRALVSQIAADARAITSESDAIGRVFASVHDVSRHDFLALLHIFVAESGGSPLSSGELRSRLGVSGAAITYLVDRMIEAGHIRRESDPADRRKVILRYQPHGMEIARDFFVPLGMRARAAMADLSDEELEAAHRVMSAFIDAMVEFRKDFENSTRRQG